MALRFQITTLFLALSISWSCTPVQHISTVKASYDVPHDQHNPDTDATIEDLILPYKIQIDDQMNQVVANLGTELTKMQPESTMGNWITDAMMSTVDQIGMTADFAIHNYGGMRIPVITPGPLTLGELYELSPFDNTLMIVDVPGRIIDSLMQFMAEKGGWPVSTQIRMVIGDRTLIRYTIQGQPVDYARTYKIAMPDFLANGGDDTRFFIGLDRVDTGVLIRDLLLADAAAHQVREKDIWETLEGRIINQK